MEAEQFLNNDLKGAHQFYDETGITLMTGIEHSEICRIMDEYHEHKLKLLGIANVSQRFIPKGWYVHEAGQNPLHMLWFVVIINFEDVANNVEKPRHFVAEECDSFEEALQECVKNVCQRLRL